MKCRSLYISMTDRSNWEELTSQAVFLIKELLHDHPTETEVTLLGESFGGCLALRCASVAPELFERMIVVNPATSFCDSYGGLLNLVASTNLLSIFPEPLYQVAQAVLLPFLVDRSNVGGVGMEAVRQMIHMSPPENRKIAELASSHGPSAQSRHSMLEGLESYGPAAAGSWRLGLLVTGNLSDERLSGIRVPTLLISSAKDRLLGSLQEGARLERVMQNAMRVVLPKSGHTALLEDDVKLVEILRQANFVPDDIQHVESQHYDTCGASAARSKSRERQRGPNGYMAGQQFQSNTVHRRPNRHASTQTQALPSERVIRISGRPSTRAMAVNDETAGSSMEDAMSRSMNGNKPLEGSGFARDGGGTADTSFTSSERNQMDVTHNAAPRAASRGADVLNHGRSKVLREALWSRPHPAFDRLTAMYSPLREVISPVVSGIENLPSGIETQRPLLLVGNHARIGLYDMPLLMIELYLRKIKVRGLAHPAHWKGPFGRVFESFGAVKASPLSAFKLLRAGEAVLLFPGGGREVNKKKGENYQLFWSEEPDFVRMAAKLDALIIPFASVGGDEAFDIRLDSEEVVQAPILGDVVRASMQRVAPDLDPKESVPPLTNLPGLGIPSPLPLPNFARLYFRFMPPIDPGKAEGILTDIIVTRRVYAEVKQQVHLGISELQHQQQMDTRRSLPARLMDQFVRSLPAFEIL